MRRNDAGICPIFCRRCGCWLAPLAAWLILNDHDTAALAVFAAAGLSDRLDGFIARHWHVTSRFGAWLDPAADKLLMLLCFIALLRRRRRAALAGGAGGGARCRRSRPAWLLVKAAGSADAHRAAVVGKASTVVQIALYRRCAAAAGLRSGMRRIWRWRRPGTVALFTVLSAAAYAALFPARAVFGRARPDAS